MPTKKKTGTNPKTPTFVAAFRAFIAKQRWPHKRTVKRAEVEKATVEQIMQKLLDTTPTTAPGASTGASGGIRFP